MTAGRKGGGGRPLLQAPMPKVVLWECMRVGLLISVWVAAPGWVGKVEERQGHRCRAMCVCVITVHGCSQGTWDPCHSPAH